MGGISPISPIYFIGPGKAGVSLNPRLINVLEGSGRQSGFAIQYAAMGIFN